jgi:hypothetical protein
VQPKNVLFPIDARLLNLARDVVVSLAKGYGVNLRQSYPRVGKPALITSALFPCQAVQARQPLAEEARDLSGPGHPPHRPQD